MAGRYDPQVFYGAGTGLGNLIGGALQAREIARQKQIEREERARIAELNAQVARLGAEWEDEPGMTPSKYGARLRALASAYDLPEEGKSFDTQLTAYTNTWRESLADRNRQAAESSRLKTELDKQAAKTAEEAAKRQLEVSQGAATVAPLRTEGRAMLDLATEGRLDTTPTQEGPVVPMRGTIEQTKAERESLQSGLDVAALAKSPEKTGEDVLAGPRNNLVQLADTYRAMAESATDEASKARAYRKAEALARKGGVSDLASYRAPKVEGLEAKAAQIDRMIKAGRITQEEGRKMLASTGETKVEVNTGERKGEVKAFEEGAKAMIEDFSAKKTKAENAVKVSGMADEAIKLIESGARTGITAAWKQDAAKALGEMGFDVDTNAITDTDTLQSLLASNLLGGAKSQLSGVLSDSDMKLLADAAGGLRVESRALINVLRRAQRQSATDIEAYNEMVPEVKKYRPDARPISTKRPAVLPSGAPAPAKTFTAPHKMGK